MEGDCIPADVDSMRASFVLFLDGLSGGGDFAFIKALLKAVKSGRNVVLLSTRHSPEHYEALFKKSMLDLRLGNIRSHVKIMYLVPGNLVDGLIGQEEIDRVSAANKFYPCAHYDWNSFEAWMSSTLQLERNDDYGEKEALFIDDLDTFEAVAPSRAAARKMTSKLLSCVHTSKGGAIDLLVAKGNLLWADFEEYAQSVPENPEPSLTEVCKYRANYTVQVVPLSTGFSNDVHGMVKATGMKEGLMKCEEFTFKTVNVNTVQFTRLSRE